MKLLMMPKRSFKHSDWVPYARNLNIRKDILPVLAILFWSQCR